VHQSFIQYGERARLVRSACTGALLLLVVGCATARNSGDGQGRKGPQSLGVQPSRYAPPDNVPGVPGHEVVPPGFGTPELPEDAQPIHGESAYVYLASMHRRIHRLWGAGVIEDWDADKTGSRLSDSTLVVVLEIILNADGTVSRVNVEKTSGYDAYDAAALDVVYSAAPYAPVPADIRSINGKGYLRWAFHRDSRQCASTYASLFVWPGPETAVQPGIAADRALPGR
jgi:TonB family protein